MLVLECTSMKTMRVNSEQRWVAYKETVAKSLDKALELFATKKVDSRLHLDRKKRIVGEYLLGWIGDEIHGPNRRI